MCETELWQCQTNNNFKGFHPPKPNKCTVALFTLCSSVFGQYSEYPCAHPPQCHPNNASVDSLWKGKLWVYMVYAGCHTHPTITSYCCFIFPISTPSSIMCFPVDGFPASFERFTSWRCIGSLVLMLKVQRYCSVTSGQEDEPDCVHNLSGGLARIHHIQCSSKC